MRPRVIPIHWYVEASHIFHWASKRHYQLLFTGKENPRHRRSETVLKRLTDKGKLRAIYDGKRLIYALPSKNDDFFLVKHGLACTECLVRFYRSDTDGTVIAEKHFKGMGSVPEWGILYPNGNLLLFEFCTRSNFLFSRNVIGKLAAYERNLPAIEERFNAKAGVVFVVEVSRQELERFLGRPSDGNKFFFTDYETFLKVPIGRALYEPIYIWSFDGKLYPLRKNV